MATAGFARDYIIYSISQDFPMGIKNEQLKKNYYVNLGKAQGVRSGTKLSVVRAISRLNPYDNNTRHSYKVPIGVLEIVHSENDASIAKLTEIFTEKNDPQFDLDEFMIGDMVSIKIVD